MEEEAEGSQRGRGRGGGRRAGTSLPPALPPPSDPAPDSEGGRRAGSQHLTSQCFFRLRIGRFFISIFIFYFIFLFLFILFVCLGSDGSPGRSMLGAWQYVGYQQTGAGQAGFGGWEQSLYSLQHQFPA